MTVFPTLGYAFLISHTGMSQRDFGWGQSLGRPYHWKDVLGDYIWLVIGWSFGLAIIARLCWLFLWPIDDAAHSPSLRPEHGIWWLAVGALWTIAPAFIEETFFRGLLWTFFERIGFGVQRPIPFMIVSGSLFGLGHFAQGLSVTVTMTFIGFFLGWHYSKVRQVLPFVLAHLSVNFFALFVV